MPTDQGVERFKSTMAHHVRFTQGLPPGTLEQCSFISMLPQRL